MYAHVPGILDATFKCSSISSCSYMSFLYKVYLHSNSHSVYRLVPYREQNSGPGAKLKKYSPFQVAPSNKADFAVARLDDLVNWSLKVGFIYKLL